MVIVRDPQKRHYWTGPLRCLIKTALLVAPLYVFVAAWALWLRVAQYGWTVDRLQGALAVLVLLVWSLGYFVSIVWRNGQNPCSSGQSEPCGFVIGVGDTGAS